MAAEVELSTVIAVGGFVLTASNIVLGFAWKHIHTEFKEQKEEMNKIWTALTKKADAEDMEARRLDVKQLFDEMHQLERRMTETMNDSVTKILVQIGELKGEQRASNSRSTQRRN